MTRKRSLWWTPVLGLAMAVAAPAGGAAQAPRDTVVPVVPRDSGLILSSAEAAARAPARKVENLSITVDLSDRKLYVMSGSEVVKHYPVAVGAPSWPTPTGQFRTTRMIWNPSWTPPPSAWARDDKPKGPGEPGNPMGRVKIFFRAPDYYIHGTGIASSLGRSASHGCIRMRNADVVELAKMLMENGGATREQGWYEETVETATRSREVTLRSGVPVRIRA